MTNIEILEKEFDSEFENLQVDITLNPDLRKIVSALDAAREDEAVAILEWQQYQGHERSNITGLWTNGSVTNLTTKDVYQLYLKHKNEKK